MIRKMSIFKAGLDRFLSFEDFQAVKDQKNRTDAPRYPRRAGIARLRAPPNSLQAEPATGITLR